MSSVVLPEIPRHGPAPAVPSGAAPSLEMQVLLCAARVRLTPHERARLVSLLMQGPDWVRLGELAALHKLAPLMYWHLRTLDGHVPAEAMHFFRTYFDRNVRRVLELTREMIGLVRALETQGIAAVAYKGPALAVEAYGNIVLRQAGDIDLLVRREDMPYVRGLLRQRGYEREHELDRAGEELTARSLYHEAFHHPGGPIVEVHWAFTDVFHGFTLNLDEAAPHLTTISLGGERVRSLGREDLLLALCVHGAKHRWCRLEWAMGVAELLRSARQPDWPVLLERATSLGSRRVLLLGLHMARELLDAPLPADIERLVRHDPLVRSLARDARSHVLNTSDRWGELQLAPRDVFYLHLNERGRDKLKFLLHRLTTPSQAKSWRGVHVGRVYLPLHYFVRPFQSWRPLLQTLRWYMTPHRTL